ncbi:MAG: alanine racemase [Oscillospiraceae bacterium]|nr:alanine racemase [Oscillospiraceae bacterium]
MEFLKRSWAEINLDALEFNIQNIRRRLDPKTKLLGVVKADAYGHGAQHVAEEMLKLGADWLGVSNAYEGIALRKGGITDVPILNFGITPPELAGDIAKYHITQTVYSWEYAKALNAAAAENQVVIDIHVKIDTGMSRIGFDGFDCDFAVSEIEKIEGLKNLNRTGIFTHFARSDEDTPESSQYTNEQYQRFMNVCDELSKRGLELGIRHCCNSGAVLNHPEMQLDMVRPGIIMYGMHPDATTKGKLELKPAMSLKSTVSMVKEIPAGRKVSYGGTYETTAPTRIATIPVGYADGYSRLLSNKSRVIINGCYAPVIGRVCMDQMMVDVTAVPNVVRGSEVVLAGKSGELEVTLDELGGIMGTVNYEICCIVSKRMPRVYLKNGKTIDIIDHIL